MMDRIIIERIESKSEYITETGCLIFTGSQDAHGYGRIRWKGKTMRAHRLNYISRYGSLPKGMFVLHKCDIPSCVNINHLYVGTHSQNMLDRSNRGGFIYPSGQDHWSAKLTEHDVIEIRKKCAEGKMTQTEIAKQYGVRDSVITNIKKRKTWSHVK